MRHTNWVKLTISYTFLADALEIIKFPYSHLDLISKLLLSSNVPPAMDTVTGHARDCAREQACPKLESMWTRKYGFSTLTSTWCQAESYEDEFKAKLYKKGEVCRKVLIPKDAYFTMLEDFKTVAADTGTKNRHGYYLLSK